MSHTNRVERHILVDVLAGSCGASGLSAILQRSWLAAVLSLVLGVVLYFLERETIQEEDEIQEEKMKVPDLMVETLKKIAAREPAKHIVPEGQPFYDAGLSDGAATLAQHILDNLKGEDQ